MGKRVSGRPRETLLVALLSEPPVIALHFARTAGSIFLMEKRAKKRTICLIAQQLGLPHAIIAQCG